MKRKDYLYFGIALFILAAIMLMAYCSAGCAVVSTNKSDDMTATTGGTNVKVQTVAPTNGYDFALDLIKWSFKWIVISVVAFWIVKAWIDGDLNPVKSKHRKEQT